MLEVRLLAAAVRRSLLARYVSSRASVLCCASHSQSHRQDCWQVFADHAHDDRDGGYDDAENDNDDQDSCSDTFNCQCHNIDNCVDNKLDFNRFVSFF